MVLHCCRGAQRRRAAAPLRAGRRRSGARPAAAAAARAFLTHTCRQGCPWGRAAAQTLRSGPGLTLFDRPGRDPRDQRRMGIEGLLRFILWPSGGSLTAPTELCLRPAGSGFLLHGASPSWLPFIRAITKDVSHSLKASPARCHKPALSSLPANAPPRPPRQPQGSRTTTADGPAPQQSPRSRTRAQRVEAAARSDALTRRIHPPPLSAGAARPSSQLAPQPGPRRRPPQPQQP